MVTCKFRSKVGGHAKLSLGEVDFCENITWTRHEDRFRPLISNVTGKSHNIWIRASQSSGRGPMHFETRMNGSVVGQIAEIRHEIRLDDLALSPRIEEQFCVFSIGAPLHDGKLEEFLPRR